MTLAKRISQFTRLNFTLSNLYLLLAFTFAILLIRTDYSALTWGKFSLFDYGIYTNMMWNSVHGSPFKCLVDGSYLSTHLSFTLALPALSFWIWDHPFLLSVLQWLFLIGGALILWKGARIHRLSYESASALVLFFIANPFTQSVMLSEFHTVGLYFLLIPWLYYVLSNRKSGVWLPLLLILGVREEAGLLILPMLVYFSIRDRWKMGVVWSGLAIGYCIFALKVLFPLLAGMTFVGRRGMPVNFHTLFEISQIMMRARPLLWCLLAVSVFLRKKGWIPILVFPLTALGTSAVARQVDIYLQGIHYPAGLIVCVTLGILEAVVRSVKGDESTRSLNRPWVALFLCVVTLCWHVAMGFLPFSKSHLQCYGAPNPGGKEVLKAARYIPKEGILLCQRKLAPFCANRADLLTWKELKETKYQPDVVFFSFAWMGDYKEEYRELIESGRFGVSYLGHNCAILQKGFSISRNDEILQTYFAKDSGE